MEDKRFIELPSAVRSDVPRLADWFCEQEDYLTDEIVGIYTSEINDMKSVVFDALDLFTKATDHLIDNGNLGYLGIPKYFQRCIEHSWRNQERHPFLLGRIDFSGGINNMTTKIIEFNADTCTMIPETMYWQPYHLGLANKMMSFNRLKKSLSKKFTQLRHNYSQENPVVLGTSLGFAEDSENIKAILSDAISEDQYFKYYLDLEQVVFTEDGVFVEEEDGYIPVDILLKLFPWEWAYDSEPELAKILSDLILEDKITVLNPPYTAIWQNKKFLNYITEHFPNEVIAKSYDSAPDGIDHVVKSSHGRLGEEVMMANEAHQRNFDIATYQEYLNLPKDDEGCSYQLSMYVTDEPCALNIRCQEGLIINDDCEFYAHYIIS